MIRRAVGLTVVVGFLLLWQPDSLDPWQRVVLPAVLAIGAWLVVNNVAAVALAVLALAAVHTDVHAADAVYSRLYPAVAVAAALTVVVIYGRRFADYMKKTQAARRARRDAAG
jgi:hypothetical protein